MLSPPRTALQPTGSEARGHRTAECESNKFCAPLDLHICSPAHASSRRPGTMWWSGLAQNAVVAALGRIGRPLAAVLTPWAHLFRDRFEESTGAGSALSPAQVYLLAHEDVASRRTPRPGTVISAVWPLSTRSARHCPPSSSSAWWSGLGAGTFADARCDASTTAPASARRTGRPSGRVTPCLRRGYDDSRVIRAGVRGAPALIASAAP